MKSTSIKTMDMRKVSKTNKKQQQKTFKSSDEEALPEIVSIDSKKRRLSPKINAMTDISSVAEKLKKRLSEATKRISASSSSPSLPPSPASSVKSDNMLLDASANTMLSSPDWSNKETSSTSLRNLQLLKQYLAFVSKESVNVSVKKGSLQFTLPTGQASIEPATEIEKSARCGATLIESYVHESSTMDKELHLSRPEEGRSHSRSISANRIDRKRPGRPPKANSLLVTDEDKTEQQRMRIKKKVTQQRTHQHPSHSHLKKKNIHCICSSPHEENSAMVQCDDCYRYLHLECLELNDEALTETFRCPSCFLSLGSCTGKNAKLLSAITWRYAAQWKSQRLAASSHDAMATDDEDAEEYDEDDFSAMEVDAPSITLPTPSPLSKFTFTANTHTSTNATNNNNNNNNITKTITSPSTTPPPLHLHDDDDGYSTDLPGPETPTDWPDVASESRFSSQDSASEVTTPNENLFLDPFDTKEEEGQVVLDPESLEILSRIAYLQSLDSVKKELFAPNASDVFLCENLNNSTAPVSSAQVPRFAANVPPSDICSQDLSEFSFDSGPFWEPLF